MVTISRIRNEHSNRRFILAGIRWKILLAFFVIVGVSFAVAAGSMTNVVSRNMYKQQTREDSLAVERLATIVAPYFQYARSDELNEYLSSAAGELGGRLMVLDADGKVQYDTFATMCGMRLQLPEVLSVLTGGEMTAYGIHRPGQNSVPGLSMESSEEAVAYCTAGIIGTRGVLGVLLYVSRIGEMMASLSSMEWQLGRIFVLIALAALALALVLSRILTNPITVLSRTMSKMGKGDLSVRVPVRGSGELRELAENYNEMASQLESLDKARNQFVSNASHELKTPLTTMKILLETLMYQPDMPAELRTEFMQDMNHEIDRLTGIITDLLTLTKMDNHSVQLEREQVDLSALTEETVRLLQPAAGKRAQTLETEITSGLQIYGDRTKLAQILYNLTDNALKYTPDGGLVTVRLFCQNGKLIWQIKDNGVGIPEEDQSHIFERFYRVDKARSRETGGTGLGLSIVRQLVHLHGGKVTVESRPGEGSLFTVTLPVKGEKGN